jgi:predicted HTH transcriptional regulator
MDIGGLLKSEEGKTLEFKRDLSSPKNLLKTLVAFANTAGGQVIIGVDNKTRMPMGFQHPLDEEERLCSLIADSIRPRLVPNVEMVSIEDKTLLVVEVFLSGSRPHWLKSEGPNDGVYVRLGSTNRQADRDLIAELRRSVESVAFDELPMPALSIDDLDLAAIKGLFGDQRHLGENELLTLRLLKTEQGQLVPTKGAILLFGKERDKHFPDAWVQCGRFIGRDKADIFDHIELHDHLPQAVDSIMLFLRKHAMRSADFSEIRRKDVWSIPLGILREVVINALVHTDYSQRGAPIRIAFFDDRIEVENPGILLPGMTIDDMRRGISKIRNHVIARVFRELNLIEQWGSGIPRIIREAQELGLPELQIMEIAMRLRFTVTLSEQITVQKAAEQVTEQVTEQVRRILICLKNEPLGARDAMQSLGLRHRPTLLYDYLQPAIDAGLVEMTQPESPKSPTQKYRLTTKGRAVLVENGHLE